MRGSKHEFVVNKVLNQLEDLTLIREINHFHNYAEEKNCLN